MNVTCSNRPDPATWAEILSKSPDAEVMHSINHYKTLEDLRHRTFYLDMRKDKEPSVLFLAYQTRRIGGVSRYLILGDRFGLSPVAINSARDLLKEAITLFDRHVAANSTAMSTVIYANIGTKQNNLTDIYLGLGYKEMEDYTCVIDLTRDVKDIWESFEGRCRTAIRKAEEYSPRIYTDNTKKGINAFYRIYSNNAKRKSFVKIYSKKYFQRLLYNLDKDNLLDVWLVELNNEPVAAALTGRFKKKASLLYLVSSGTGLKCNMNNLLLWSIIQKYQGSFDSLNIGSLGHRIYGSVGGYGKFKLSFNPEVRYSPQFVKKNERWFLNLFKRHASEK